MSTLARKGFEDVAIEDISWRVTPSALHAPVAVLWFIANRFKCGYYIVSAAKR